VGEVPVYQCAVHLACFLFVRELVLR
jgi:hypothetical protein